MFVFQLNFGTSELKYLRFVNFLKPNLEIAIY